MASVNKITNRTRNNVTSILNRNGVFTRTGFNSAKNFEGNIEPNHERILEILKETEELKSKMAGLRHKSVRQSV